MVELNLVLGSTSDWENKNIDIPGQLKRVTQEHDGLCVRVEFASAHNTPEKVREIAEMMPHIRLSAAGMSAALPGIIEAHHTPVMYNVNIGIPLSDPVFKGLSAFLAVAEMPPNNPVLCAGIDNVYCGISMAYNLSRGVKGIAAASLDSPGKGYEKMMKKLDDVLGKAIKDESGEQKSLFDDLGELRVVWTNKDKIPESAHGKIVISHFAGWSAREVGAFMELDRVLAETGGVHIALNQGTDERIVEYARGYARQFNGLRATGTMSAGSAGYTNASHFAARAMGYESSCANVAKAKQEKHGSLMSATPYIVKAGEVTQKDAQ